MMSNSGSSPKSNHSQSLKITHVIFDVDGLIIDTERIYTECMEEMCAEYGCKFTWEIKQQQMGMKEKEAAQVLIDALNIPMTVDEYGVKLKKKLEEKLPTVNLMPGAEKLIRHLDSHQVPIAVASGSDNWGYAHKTANHKELFSLFHHTVLSSDDPDVRQGKPAPDCFLVAAKRFDDEPHPSNILVFEDAPNGAEAGLAAGMHVVWVPDSRADRAALQDRVTQVLTTLEEFDPSKYGLPPFT